MKAPDGTLCTKSHEFVIEDSANVYKVGITDYAAEQLGDIVFVELPEVGAEYEKGEIFGTVESVKAASELYMPISGKIVELNEKLLNAPELVNTDTYESGWFVKVEVPNKDELNELMEYEDYLEDIEE